MPTVNLPSAGLVFTVNVMKSLGSTVIVFRKAVTLMLPFSSGVAFTWLLSWKSVNVRVPAGINPSLAASFLV